MIHFRLPLVSISWLAICVGGFAQEKPKINSKMPPKVQTDNKNGLITKYRDQLKLSASSSYPGWECPKAIDGKLETSWFTNTNDSVAKGTKPWFEVKFPEDVTVAP